MLQVGVDCENISRFRRLPYPENRRFYQRIFTPQEIEYCIRYRDPYPRFAVRFAAKEAAIKALSGIAKPFYKDIRIQKDKKNRPRIRINSNRFKKTSNLTISLSLTHSDSYAVAFTIVTNSKSVVKSKVGKIGRKSAAYIKRTIGR